MYLSSFWGQGVSSCPGLSGWPTVCMAGTKLPELPSMFSAPAPMRVMMRAFKTA